jgi:hypothetical protein
VEENGPWKLIVPGNYDNHIKLTGYSLPQRNKEHGERNRRLDQMHRFQAEALTIIDKCHLARHSGRDCRNPGYMDVFKLAIPGTGYPLPGGYDDFLYLCV